MWRHKYNTSFYQLAEEIASPVTKSTVLSTIINRNDSTFPTDADYFKIIQTCEPSPVATPCLGKAAGHQIWLSNTNDRWRQNCCILQGPLDMQLLPYNHPNARCSAKSELHHLQGILMLQRAVASDL